MVTKRTQLVSVLTIVLTSMSLVFGSGVGTRSAAYANAHTASSKSVVIAATVFPDSLNPIAGFNSRTDGDLQNITEPQGNIISYNGQGNLQAGMIAKVPTTSNGGISANGRTITITLLPGLKWSDGASITNKDYVFAWKIDMNANTGPACGGTCDIVGSITLTGTLGITLHLKHAEPNSVPTAIVGILPHSWAALGSPAQLSACLNAVSPAYAGCNHVAKKFLDPTLTYLDNKAVTAGPYMVSTVTPNSQIVFAANPYYSKNAPGGTPKLHQITFKSYSTIPALTAALDNHAVDLAWGYSTAQYAQLSGDSHFQTIAAGVGFGDFLIFNTRDASVNIDPNGPTGVNNPVTDGRVRQALSLAYSRSDLVAKVNSVSAAIAKKFVSYDVPLLRTTLSQPEYSDPNVTGVWDPIAKAYVLPGSSQAMADAKTLLADAGNLHPTIYLVTLSGSSTRAAEIHFLQTAWSKIGVSTVLETETPSQLYNPIWTTKSSLTHGNFEAAVFAAYAAGSVANSGYWDNWFLSNRCMRADPHHDYYDQNYSCISNAGIDQALAKASTAKSDSARHKWYNQFSEAVVKNAYWNALQALPGVVITTDGVVLGLKNSDLVPTAYVYDWH